MTDRAELVDALHRYGDHLRDCTLFTKAGKCSCGLTALKRKYRRPSRPIPESLIEEMEADMRADMVALGKRLAEDMGL